MQSRKASDANRKVWTPIIKRTAKSADHFLDLLDPRGELFGNYHYPGGWIFRGQSEAPLPLIPSAFRDKVSFINSQGYWMNYKRSTMREQIRYEASTLLYFSSMADQNGLEVPEDTQLSRKLLRRICYCLEDPETTRAKAIAKDFLKGKLQWLPDDLFSLGALAQHHGLPTRLLDWSHNPFAAAYFAVSDVARIMTDDPSKVKAEQLCVWALSSLNLKCDTLCGQDEEHFKENEIVLFTAPGATNANLLAQRGIFTLHRPKTTKISQPFIIHSLDSLLKHPQFQDVTDPKRPVLYKIELSVNHAQKALRLLSKEFINASRLFPGFDGVVKGLLERRYWDEQKITSKNDE